MTSQHKQDNLPVSVFISYAHTDEALREELEKHLSSLQREGRITTWHDRHIVPGMDWAREIDDAINSAAVILLLISANFVASDYCYGIEMQRALQRQREGKAYVIPILLRPVDRQDLPFAHLQYLPRDARPITSWPNQDEAFADVAQGIRRVLDHHALPSLSSTDRQNRTRMLKRVRVFWIEGVLEQSLHQAARIELGLQEQPDALANPWRLMVQEANLPPRPLPAGTSITQVYDQAHGELLILGDPGAGKTALLLELARDLLTRAERDITLPIPVVFNLSSWAQKRAPFADWLVEELAIRYEVPRKVGRVWVEQKRILPLLDGLDEVQQEARSACVVAINDFHTRFQSVSPVVCSRTTEYFAQKQRVAFLCAVTIEPLTPQQIDVYLTCTQGQLEAIRTALHENVALQELTTTPLMLTVLTLAYPGKSIDDLLEATSREAQQRHLFETYVERMLSRRGATADYTPQQTRHYLVWLAQQLSHHNQTEFYIEDIQRNWLPNARTYQRCLGLVFGSIVGLFISLVYIATFLFEYGSWYETASVSLSLGAFSAGVLILLYRFVFMWLGTADTHRRMIEKTKYSYLNIKKYITSLLEKRVFYGLLVGLPYGLFVSLYIKPLYAILHGVFFGIAYALVGRLDVDRKPTEAVTWSWKNIQNNLAKFLLGGLLLGLLFGIAEPIFRVFILGPKFILVYNFLYSHKTLIIYLIVYVLLIGTATGLGFSIMFALIGGISHKTLDKNERMTANQGIHRSAHNSIRLGLTSGLFIGLMTALIFGPIWAWIVSFVLSVLEKNVSPLPLFVIDIMNDSSLPLIGLGWGIGIGIAVALVVALRNGGVVCVQHALLRFLLWRAKSIPWNYPRFLDYAAERILLRKVGGGYIFVHRLLLDYFAELDDPVSSGRGQPSGRGG
ncbi:MAG: TIR domain-containing protein [Ktedonobacteraceae bacterium]|nr:TIR domain-containing protein [Ktedonobacteraceae bacterium]